MSKWDILEIRINKLLTQLFLTTCGQESLIAKGSAKEKPIKCQIISFLNIINQISIVFVTRESVMESITWFSSDRFIERIEQDLMSAQSKFLTD